ncbi:MAG TPA: cation:proton antiporter [Candidatus Saccharimonadia bacterium]|nr:cation:proton antiporter [Candidatus Saccharimonadia bacterium]
MNEYKLVLLVTGIALLGAAWLPHVLKRRALSFPAVYVGLGIVLYSIGLPLPDPDPIRHGVVVERLTELTVLVALLGAGIRIDTRFGWRRWSITWRLLGIAMPLTILLGWLLGVELLGYGFATAALLGAVLAPTDPVLASDLQVLGPGEGGEDPVRFSLTSEAGLNDALAFPFVWLAIAFAAAGAGGGVEVDWVRWLTIDVAWKLGGALLVGGVIGYGLMHLVFRVEREDKLSQTGDGLVALAIVLIVYGVAEVAHTYGFLAVFVAAVVIRQHERTHEYHEVLNVFAEQCERLLMALLLIGLGGAVADGVLGQLTWREWTAAIAVVAIVRPLAGWLCLWGTKLAGRERLAIAVFGVRGIGSFYYLAFAFNHGDFSEQRSLWAVVTLVVLLSILLHGLTAKPVMTQLDRWRKYRRRRWSAQPQGE